MAMQVVTVNGKEHKIQLTEIHNNDIASAQTKLENARAIERSKDTSFYFENTKKAIERQCNSVFYLKDQGHLIQCGAMNTRTVRTDISDSCCIESVVSDILLFCKSYGFFILPECHGGSKYKDIENHAVNPSIYYRTSNSQRYKLMEYGKVYEPDDLQDIIVVQYTPHYLNRSKKLTTVDVYRNGEHIRRIQDVSDYNEIPLEPEYMVYTKNTFERNNFRRAFTLYNYLQDTSYPLCYYGGSGCYPHTIETLSSLLVDWDTIDKPISDKENYYFYICNNHTKAFDCVISIASAVGTIAHIPNAFKNDSSDNYRISIPKNEKDIAEFVLYIIGKGKLYPQIWGCYVCDVIKNLVRVRRDTPDAGYTIDELSTGRVLDYIRICYEGIEDAQIVRLLASTYGNIALQDQPMQYWPYYHCEHFTYRSNSIAAGRILKRKITRHFLNTLENNNIDAAWKSEYLLYLIAVHHYPDAQFQYHASWLDQQHLDIFIPSLNIGIEFQGKQHYEPVEFFGGEEGFVIRQQLDAIKREKCASNGIRLVEWDYHIPINDINFIYAINDKVK